MLEGLKGPPKYKFSQYGISPGVISWEAPCNSVSYIPEKKCSFANKETG